MIGVTAANLPALDGDGRSTLNRDPRGRLYSEAVVRAGGLPVIVPGVAASGLRRPARAYLERLDGLILAGGGELAGGGRRRPPPGGGSRPRPLRDRPAVRGPGGGQTGSGHLPGFTVYGCGPGRRPVEWPSDRPGPVHHAQTRPRFQAAHLVTLTPGGRLVTALELERGEIMVNSGHHRQGAGLIEALERPGAAFVVGVQWHPEGRPDDGRSRALFAALVRAAGG